MVTLKEIAKKANVSVSTVSYALNNDSRIPDETREKVAQAACLLGYEGRSGKKSAVNAKKFIVLCLNTISGSIFSEIADALKEVLKNSNCELLIYLGSRITGLKTLDGLIVLNSRVSSEDISEMIKRKIPTVVMDRKVNFDGASTVTLDNYSGSLAVTKEAIASGAKSFVFVGGPLTSFESEDRYRGFCDALSGNDFKSDEALYLNGDFTKKSGLKIASFLISTNNCSDAVICANDEMAEGIIEGLESGGISVPNQTMVCGFDGGEIHAYNGYITAKANRKEWGTATAYTLLNMLNNTAKPAKVLIPVKMVRY